MDGGTVTGKTAGKVTITATAVADTSFSDSIELEVKENYVDSVTIGGGNFELNVGIKRTLTANVTSKGTVSDEEKNITWSSNQPNIASIDANSGEVTPKSAGIAKITATAGGITSTSITITVIDTSKTLSLPIVFSKFDSTGDENKNIYTHFIDTENYNPNKPLLYRLSVELPQGITITPPFSEARSYSDREADIFTVAEANKTYRFRLNIIRKPILVTETPKANTDYENYVKSGAPSRSIVKFVQSDYFYTPTEREGVPTDNAAPTFALFAKEVTPTATQILNSSVRILRNFSSDDGNTLFFLGYDDLVDDDDWPLDQNNGLNANADLLAGLNPATEYSLHWALKAFNGTFSGSLGAVTTGAKITTGTMEELGYFGWGGMAFHKITNFTLPTLLFLAGTKKPSLLSYTQPGIIPPLIDHTGHNPALRLVAKMSEFNSDAIYGESLPVLIQDSQLVREATFSVKVRAQTLEIDYLKTPQFE